MTSILRNAALASALAAVTLAPMHGFAQSTPPTSGQPSDPNGSTDKGPPPITTDQLGADYQKLSPEARAALMKQLKDKGVDGLSKMSESDARSTFESLPPDVKSQLQAKWDALTDDQRAAFKKMGPEAVKRMAADKVKDMMKPMQGIIDSGKAFLQKGRDMVQKLMQKLHGSGSASSQS